MAQIYLLSVLFLFVSAGLLLVDKYGNILLVLINLKNAFQAHKWLRIGFLIAGCILALGLTFFPMEPGPAMLGDLLPAANIVILVLYFLRQLGKDGTEVQYNDSRKIALGFITLGIAVIHFLFPGIVLV